MNRSAGPGRPSHRMSPSRDLRKDVEKVEKHVAAIDDIAQTMQDQLQRQQKPRKRQLQN